ncbi:C-C chemokine receptor type 9 [Ornithorhynchus anatinus]|uniref:C-C chemokine receptor type 9 n=1 Tax=Ornithorhynchus anatinus TaxID=9258 RepID=UPI0010A7D075|nr:C-C chemokine receptor type 9 [Ornithorhynchus anatinus]XP_028926903.1 C-C chemokine receptor type 9 [Ornithorhynchus anatinus]XP_028926904.1 C-C chemokine receptor type 9 [Ornithorhynchus anatinus]
MADSTKLISWSSFLSAIDGDDSEFTTSLDDYYYNITENVFCEKSNVRLFAKNFIPPLYWTVFTAGILGNSLVILVYWYCSQMKTMTDMFLLNLAIADLLFLFTLPFWAVAAADQWKFQNTTCKLVNSMYQMNFYSSMLLLTCIGMDRHIVIVQATRAFSWKQKRVVYSKVICLCIWMVATALCIPELTFSQATETNDVMTCTVVYPDDGTTMLKASFMMLRFILGFFLPLLVMVCCYATIIHTLLQTKRSSKHRAFKVAIAVLIVFILSQFPFNSLLLVKTIATFKPSEDRAFISSCALSTKLDIGFQITQTLAFFHSCLNPVVYVFVGEKFRQDLRKVLKKLGCIRKTSTWREGKGLSSTLLETTSGALSL